MLTARFELRLLSKFSLFLVLKWLQENRWDVRIALDVNFLRAGLMVVEKSD